MYLTFTEYTTYGGSITDETEYNQFEFEARSLINYYTFNRLTAETSFGEEVKRCMFAVIQLLYKRAEALGVKNATDNSDTMAEGPVVSYSNDGVEVKYDVLSSSNIIDLCKKEATNIIRTYLDGVKNSSGKKLLYRGYYKGE